MKTSIFIWSHLRYVFKGFCSPVGRPYASRFPTLANSRGSNSPVLGASIPDPRCRPESQRIPDPR